MELLRWGAKYAPGSDAHENLVQRFEQDPVEFVAEIRLSLHKENEANDTRDHFARVKIDGRSEASPGFVLFGKAPGRSCFQEFMNNNRGATRTPVTCQQPFYAC